MHRAGLPAIAVLIGMLSILSGCAKKDNPVAVQNYYTITGIITGSGIDVSGIKVSDGTRSATTDNTGAYSIANVPNGSYTITPAKAGLKFTPVTKSVTISGANATKIDFAASVVTMLPGMILIQAGTFNMGNVSNNTNGYDDEKPVHAVTISRSFLMQRTEMPQSVWASVMGSNPSTIKADSLPVEQVTWYEAIDFCNRLSVLEGLNPCYSGSDTNIVCDFTKNGYRLPSEAEWEFACRAGTATDFYTGAMSNPDCDPIDPLLDVAGWYCGNENTTTHVGAKKKANAFGMFDMHGNVWEWCWDRYDLYTANAATDPHGSATGIYRTYRGGAQNYYATGCRSAFRRNARPDERVDFLGFRVVRNN